MDERAGAVEDLVTERAFWQGRRVLVTGHTGFKGAWLTLWLHALGAEVVGLALAPVGRSLFVDAGVARDCVSCIADVRDPAEVQRVVDDADPQIVFHLAAQALVRPSYAAAAATWSTNVMGTVHVLDALVRSTATRAVVVVTSDKCYEHGAEARPFVEDDRLGGHDPYSSSKAAAELAVASWRRSFLDARGIGVATARAGNVIGGGDWAVDRLIPDLALSAIEHRELQVRSPHATRPWQHVLDPLAGYLRLAERLHDEPARYAGAWNFGPGAAASLPVHAIVRRFNAGLREPIPFRFADDGALHEARALSLSTDKARDELGWRPRLSIDDAIRLTIDGYRPTIRGGDQRAVVLAQIAGYLQGSASPASSAASALAW